MRGPQSGCFLLIGEASAPSPAEASPAFFVLLRLLWHTFLLSAVLVDEPLLDLGEGRIAHPELSLQLYIRTVAS